MELFQLFGTIALKNATANQAIDETTEKAEKSGRKISEAFKKTAVAAGKIAVSAIAAGATIAGALTKSAVQSYAEYEQLVGGVETLFKDSAKTVMQYADTAYKTAGLSANQYMDTVTSFSASLLQGLGGDTAKAADIANLAITDMADNANKMGTSMELIQNAYAGFAKQNYTMLDNLRLGYGGTQEEMIRLINDSGVLQEKISSLDGISFDTMIQAIHEVQTNLGITGTTAKEASTTIQGSIAAMKSAWSNLLVGLAAGNQNIDLLIKNLGDSILTVSDNLIPRIQTTLEGISTLIDKVVPQISQKLPPLLMQVLPSLLSAAMTIVKSLVTSIGSALPSMLNSISGSMMQSGIRLVQSLGDGIKENLPSAINNALDLLTGFSETLRENASLLIDAGLQLILNIGQGISNSLPSLIAKIPTIVSNIAGIINDNAPKLLVTAGKLILTLATGLIQAIPTLIANIPKIIKAIVDVLLAYNWLGVGKNLITLLKNGIENGIGLLKSAGGKIKDAVVNAIKELPSKLLALGKEAVVKVVTALKDTGSIKSAAANIGTAIIGVLKTIPSKMLSIGKNIVQGLWNGINNAKAWVISKIKGFGTSILNSIKDIFKIHSPSKETEEDGKMLALGVAKGLEDNAEYAAASAEDMGKMVLDAAEQTLTDYKRIHDMSAAQEVAYWRQIVQTTQEGTEARKSAEDKYYQALDSYKSQYKSYVDSIMKQTNLFSEFVKGEKVKGKDLINNLQSQVSGMQQYYDTIASLKGKIGNTKLFEALAEMGMDNLAELEAVNRMSEEQLQKYVSLYDEKYEMAKSAAIDKLGEVQETVDSTTAESNKVADSALKKLVSIFTTNTDNIAKVTDQKFAKVLNTIESKMKAAVSAVKKAVKEMNAAMAGSGNVTASASVGKSRVSAHASGGILTKPTIFGYTPSTNTYHLGGEAGAEAIAPIDKLQGYVKAAVASEMSDGISRMITLLEKLVDKDTSVYLNSKEISKAVNRDLGVVY